MSPVSQFRRIACGLSLALSLQVYAGPENPSEWKLETMGFESFATHAAFPRLRLPLQAYGAGGFEILSWEKAPSNEALRLLKYTAGEVGSTERVLVVRAMVVDPSRTRVLADEVFAYQDAQEPSKLQGPQPKWSWTTGTLMIQRTDRRVPLRVKLK